MKYFTGDSVLYKSKDSNEWFSPDIVIRQFSQQGFVKHGSFYVRVHPHRSHQQ